MTNFVLCIHVQIRFASTEKNYSHRLACILFDMNSWLWNFHHWTISQLKCQESLDRKNYL